MNCGLTISRDRRASTLVAMHLSFPKDVRRTTYDNLHMSYVTVLNNSRNSQRLPGALDPTPKRQPLAWQQFTNKQSTRCAVLATTVTAADPVKVCFAISGSVLPKVYLLRAACFYIILLIMFN
eukprot:scpid87333/ scgid15962/ 